jgi:hypothetical protein
VCGREVSAIVEYMPPVPSAEDSVTVQVAIRWQGGKPTDAEVLALKRFVPELHDRPITEVARRALATTEWPLGMHPLYYARGLKWQAEREGLQVVWASAEAE